MIPKVDRAATHLTKSYKFASLFANIANLIAMVFVASYFSGTTPIFAQESQVYRDPLIENAITNCV